MYNKESDKMTEIFNYIFIKLKARHEEFVKENLKQAAVTMIIS